MELHREAALVLGPVGSGWATPSVREPRGDRDLVSLEVGSDAELGCFRCGSERSTATRSLRVNRSEATVGPVDAVHRFDDPFGLICHGPSVRLWDHIRQAHPGDHDR
jgi:hypothetical protein